MKISRKILCAIIALFALNIGAVNAQGVDIVTLTTTAQGITKDVAVQNALRNAIEQVFGAFVSSNTQIVNDELTRDEIVTVSSGHVKKFDVLSESKMPDGNIFVAVKAEVSAVKLAKYAESKGASVKFNGAAFAANSKLAELYCQNEKRVLENLAIIIDKMLSSDCFDYEIEVSEPEASIGGWELTHFIRIIPNENFDNVRKVLVNTLSGISVTQSGRDYYTSSGQKLYNIRIEEDVLDEMTNKNKKKKEKNITPHIPFPGNERTLPDIYRTTVRYAPIDYQTIEPLRKDIEVSVRNFYLRTGQYPILSIFDMIVSKKYSCVVNNGVFESKWEYKNVIFGGHTLSEKGVFSEENYGLRDRYVTGGNQTGIDGTGKRVIRERQSGTLFNRDKVPTLNLSKRSMTGGIYYRKRMPLSTLEKIQKYTVEGVN